jgi:hypothetical protein
LLLVLCVLAPVALACPTCSCANPALTSMGADQPFDDDFVTTSALKDPW